MSEIWVRKDRKVKMIVKDLGELFLGMSGGPGERKRAVFECSEYVGVISIFPL